MRIRRIIYIFFKLILLCIFLGLAGLSYFALSFRQTSTYFDHRLIYIPFVIAFLLIMAFVLCQKKSAGRKFFFILSLLVFVLCNIYGYLSSEKELKLRTVGKKEKEIAETYLPFNKDSKIAKLDKDPSFTLKDNVPVLDGAISLFPFYSALFNEVYPYEKILDINDKEVKNIHCNDTENALMNLLYGENINFVDIVFTNYPSKKILNIFSDNNVIPKIIPIGKDGLVFYVNKNNPVKNITVDQLIDIYTGQIKNWKELGGNDSEIIPYQNTDNSGSQSSLERIIKTEQLLSPPMENGVSPNGVIEKRLAKYRNSENAIGFSFLYYAEHMTIMDDMKILSINGIYPTDITIANNTYPFINYYYAITTKEKTDSNLNIEKLIDWILSDEGQELVKRAGYVPLDKKVEPVNTKKEQIKKEEETEVKKRSVKKKRPRKKKTIKKVEDTSVTSEVQPTTTPVSF